MDEDYSTGCWIDQVTHKTLGHSTFMQSYNGHVENDVDGVSECSEHDATAGCIASNQ
jgi:hypothetical protein